MNNLNWKIKLKFEVKIGILIVTGLKIIKSSIEMEKDEKQKRIQK
jgi:hypothetical protein